MIKKNLILNMIMLIVIGLHQLSAQSRTFEDISTMKLQNVGAITEDEELRGYYTFYKVGKASKGKSTFILKLLDENLQDAKTITMEESKHFYMLDGAYNGQAILLKFLDWKNKKLVFRTYDRSARLTSTSSRTMDNSELIAYKAVLSGYAS